MTDEEARSIQAYRSEDIQEFGCPTFECRNSGGEFRYSGTPEEGAGLWLCHQCRTWVVADSKRTVGEMTSLAVGPKNGWVYPVIRCHPIYQEGSVAATGSS